MTAGKNKKKFKTKGKKKIDPQTKKEWYDFKAPAPFEIKPFGKTCINRTQGTKIATEELKGRVVECYLSDLKKNSEQLHWRKIKLVTEDVEGRNCRTSFYGMDMTRDKLCQFIRKWQTLIEAHVDVKTQDGYFLRLFIIGFTTKQKDQIKKTSYAFRSQIKTIRKRMVQVVSEEAQSNNLTKFISSLIGDEIGDKIVEKCKFVYPLQHVIVKKVKMLKKPKFDITKLNELYNESKRGAEEKSGDKKDDDKEVENLLKK